ncbi:hydantoinase B/oxoprolinase family protein [Bradyrhizobium sp. BRP14]|nr:hydantoinase B/oxoprolinase family protein [Bradyrhizobium sp. BRP14]
MAAANDSARTIHHQIMWNRLIAVVGEQAKVLIRTAFSPVVRECEDISAGVFDLTGRMLAQAVTGTPGHINSMAEAVRHFIRHFPVDTMNDGDAYITNDPWMGTGHLNDFVVVTPAFHHGKLVALFACTSHLMDIGGMGVSPESTDVYMEGLYIPMLKLIDKGVVNETLMAIIKANTRLPIDTEGDTYSLAACNDVGVKALSHMMDEFGINDLTSLGDHIVEHSRNAVLKEIARLPKGSWSYSIKTDGYDEPITLKAKLTISYDKIEVDFAGSSQVIPRGINVPLAYAKAYTAFGIGCVIAANIPNNAGSLAPISVIAPENCILNPRKPAPVAARHILGQMLPDLVFGCLRQALPGRIPAEGTACIYDITVRGRSELIRDNDNVYSLCITTNGGTGARPGQNGLSATSFPSGVHGTPIEIAELASSLIFLKKELRLESGGKGKSRGGDGQIIEVANIEGASFELLATFDRIDFPPRGADGGLDGAPGFVGLTTGEKLKGKGNHVIAPGQTLLIMSPGGGGLGSPQAVNG